ncbi:THAP-type domain-containing protein, partial [Aphis craccivora]
MDKLFDILNSKKKFDGKDFTRSSKNTAQQRGNLLLICEVFENMTVFEKKTVDGEAYQNSENSTYGNLNVPPNEFYNYVSELDTIFVSNFPTLAIENDVGKKLKNLVENVPFNHPCPKFDVGYLKALYI